MASFGAPLGVGWSALRAIDFFRGVTMNKNAIAIVALAILFASCGDDDGPSSSNPPSVAGTYTCISGCFGTCNFDNTLTVTQNGSSIIIRSNSFPDSQGTVFDDGSYQTESSNCSCSGQFILDSATSNCRCGGVTCQTVTYSVQ